MSYDIYLVNLETKDTVIVERHEEGGTYIVGGSTDAHLNITYNYSQFFYNTIDREKGIRWLYGRKAKDCINKLTEAVKSLGTVKDQDYWKETEGNAGYALSILLRWAHMHLEAIFEGD